MPVVLQTVQVILKYYLSGEQRAEYFKRLKQVILQKLMVNCPSSSMEVLLFSELVGLMSTEEDDDVD